MPLISLGETIVGEGSRQPLNSKPTLKVLILTGYILQGDQDVSRIILQNTREGCKLLRCAVRSRAGHMCQQSAIICLRFLLSVLWVEKGKCRGAGRGGWQLRCGVGR